MGGSPAELSSVQTDSAAQLDKCYMWRTGVYINTPAMTLNTKITTDVSAILHILPIVSIQMSALRTFFDVYVCQRRVGALLEERRLLEEELGAVLARESSNQRIAPNVLPPPVPESFDDPERIVLALNELYSLPGARLAL